MDKCIFNWISTFVILFGLLLYIYNIVIDSQEPDINNRPIVDTIWIWTFFILLIIAFFLNTFC